MSARAGIAWRFAVLLGLASGLAAAPFRPLSLPLWLPPALWVPLVALRPHGQAWRLWVLLVGAVATIAGMVVGSARLEALDSRALTPAPGQWVKLRGTIVSQPSAGADGTTTFVAAVGERRIAISASPRPGLDEGRMVRVSGTVREPVPWERDALLRLGASRVVVAAHLESTVHARTGLRGRLDDVRRRAEDALTRGTSATAAALLRGFVLGQDDEIPDVVTDQFRRSGLAHILAVSGQNVMLLVLLAAPILALAGVPHRARLLALATLIAVYVPVAGAGASIQRAGVMGMAGLAAVLAGRPRSAWYALLLAAVVTLALEPRATADIGWQLSFAAVAGLGLLARPLSRALAGERSGHARRAITDGVAMTLAATLATAPLVAYHFGAVSLTAVAANALALPAVAPAMWFGMLAAALGQVPSAPVEPLTAVGGLCAGFIGWVAHLLGGTWAQIEVEPPGPITTLMLTAGLLSGARLACAAAERRGSLRGAARASGRSAIGVAVACVVLLAVALPRGGAPEPSRTPRLLIRVLDVGQGDSILLEPRGSPPILVDTGPPDGGVAGRLGGLGAKHLGALVITHDETDHSGALAELVDAVTIDRLIVAPGGRPTECGRQPGTCPPVRRVDAGEEIVSGDLRLRVLWPRGPAGDDPNAHSLVLRAELGGFAALLTGDAEAAVAAYETAPVDFLKVAHHGSEDPGLGQLLDRAAPQLAVISVGADNGYGHPSPATLSALATAGIPTLRTDVHGEVVVRVGGDGWTVG